MNVSLPKAQKAFVDDRVTAGGFSSVSDYMRELIRRDQREQEREQEREELEQRLLKALESPRSEMTKDDWKELRDNLLKRHGG
jgi:antitoxin ParD1/3/4